jgi:hypothetical protein
MPRQPLPFPVRDTADLRRAVRYVARDGDSHARRYVVARARALGCTDMLPPGWLKPMPQRTLTHMSLDQRFKEKSVQCGIGVAKLKAVYFRGVEEFQSSDFDMGTPMMWGLARVQRFINCVQTGAPMQSDTDLLATANEIAADCGIDISVDAGAVLADVLYSSGSQIRVEDDIITVDGTIDGTGWSYSLDTISGEHDLFVE